MQNNTKLNARQVKKVIFLYLIHPSFSWTNHWIRYCVDFKDMNNFLRGEACNKFVIIYQHETKAKYK